MSDPTATPEGNITVEKKPLILAVDDNPVNLIVLEGILEQDYRLVQANSGSEALQAVKDQDVDLILLDIAMPEMDGYEVCRRLKQDAATHGIPVIFLTAAESRGHELVGLSVGAIDYLPKPVEEQILLARVRNHLALVQARKDLTRANDLLETRVRERTAQLDKSNMELQVKIQQHQLTLDQLERTVADLDAANRVKDEFLSIMSHELRTPLNGIIGMTDLAEMVSTDPEQVTFLKTAKQAAIDLNRLVTRMLDYVQLGSGNRTADAIPFDLKEVITQAMNRYAAQAELKSLHWRLDLGPDVPNEQLGDAALLRAVLDELLDNAITFTDAGEVSVSLTVDLSPNDSRQLHFIVQDTGCGISSEALSKVFEPFKQLDGSATRKHGGIGLGLALAKKRVELMGGDIWADISPPKGTCFHFTIQPRTP